MKAPNVILVGFMGTGKTTVGRALAEALGRPFVDMDVELERRAGKAVSRIFAEDGEPAFRRMERALAAELARRDSLVVAAGGGIVLDPANLRELSAAGRVFCLQAEPAEILRRVSGSRERPLLEAGAKAERIRALLQARRALYASIPDQVRTDGRTPDDIVAELRWRLAEKSPHQAGGRPPADPR